MLWLYLALIAYSINAVAFIIDKYLLHSPIPKPYSYAFGVSVLSLSSLLLIPFGIHWYGWYYFFIAMSSGLVFFVSLVYLYKAIISSDISVAATQVGTVSAIFTNIFAVLILKEVQSFSSSLAFVFLILGIVLLGKAEKRIIKFAILSGILSGLYFVLVKLTFNLSNYLDGLFWTRIGFVAAAFSSLLMPNSRKEVYNTFKHAPESSKFIFTANKIISGAGFLILYFAIRLGDVAIVNSLTGFQFLFTFILALSLRHRIPGIEEKLNKEILIAKIGGILLISIGFVILFIS